MDGPTGRLTEDLTGLRSSSVVIHPASWKTQGFNRSTVSRFGNTDDRALSRTLDVGFPPPHLWISKDYKARSLFSWHVPPRGMSQYLSLCAEESIFNGAMICRVSE